MTDLDAEGNRYVKFWVAVNPESNLQEEDVDFQQMFDGKNISDSSQSGRPNPTTDALVFGGYYQPPDGTSRPAGSETHHAGLNSRTGGSRSPPTSVSTCSPVIDLVPPEHKGTRGCSLLFMEPLREWFCKGADMTFPLEFEAAIARLERDPPDTRQINDKY